MCFELVSGGVPGLHQDNGKTLNHIRKLERLVRPACPYACHAGRQKASAWDSIGTDVPRRMPVGTKEARPTGASKRQKCSDIGSPARHAVSFWVMDRVPTSDSGNKRMSNPAMSSSGMTTEPILHPATENQGETAQDRCL